MIKGGGEGDREFASLVYQGAAYLPRKNLVFKNDNPWLIPLVEFRSDTRRSSEAAVVDVAPAAADRTISQRGTLEHEVIGAVEADVVSNPVGRGGIVVVKARFRAGASVGTGGDEVPVFQGFIVVDVC